MSWFLFLVRSVRRAGLVRYVLLPMSTSLALGDAGAAPATPPHRIEVFTVAGLEITPPDCTAPGQPAAGVALQVYRLDGIQQVERTLSAALPGNPENARQVVLARFQQLDPSATTQLQQAAVGLAKAMQYGIDRYPAIVFDGEAAIYGVTDMGEAQHRYQAWRVGRKR